jgi:hypothetical protein
VLPYLHIKKKQAQLAVKFQATMTTGGRSLTDKQRQIRKSYKEKISALNQGINA